jgi:hypothetical protein
MEQPFHGASQWRSPPIWQGLLADELDQFRPKVVGMLDGHQTPCVRSSTAPGR